MPPKKRFLRLKEKPLQGVPHGYSLSDNSSILLTNPLGEKVEKALVHVEAPIKVAVMGCVVNGPGEAREARVGVAGGRGHGLLFREGEVIRKLPEAEIVAALVEEVENIASPKGV